MNLQLFHQRNWYFQWVLMIFDACRDRWLQVHMFGLYCLPSQATRRRFSSVIMLLKRFFASLIFTITLITPPQHCLMGSPSFTRLLYLTIHIIYYIVLPRRSCHLGNHVAFLRWFDSTAQTARHLSSPTQDSINVFGSGPRLRFGGEGESTLTARLPSRKLTYPTLGSSENHLQNAIFWGIC